MDASKSRHRVMPLLWSDYTYNVHTESHPKKKLIIIITGSERHVKKQAYGPFINDKPEQGLGGYLIWFSTDYAEILNVMTSQLLHVYKIISQTHVMKFQGISSIMWNQTSEQQFSLCPERLTRKHFKHYEYSYLHFTIFFTII